MAKIIVGIAGQIASGKDTVSKYIADEYGATRYGSSSIFRSALKDLFLPETRENLQKISLALRQAFGDDLVARVLREDIERTDGDFIVVDGVRRLSDILLLKQEPNFYLLYVDAPMELRYERIVKRAQNADDQTKTLEEFREDNEREAEVSIKALQSQANGVVENTGDLKALFDQVNAFIKKIDPTGSVCQKKEKES